MRALAMTSAARTAGAWGTSLLVGVLLPVIATWLFLGPLMPIQGDPGVGAFAKPLFGLVCEHPVPFGAFVFLLFALLFGYVRREVGRHFRPPADSQGSPKQANPDSESVGEGRARTKRAILLFLTVGSAAVAAVVLRVSLFQPYRVLSASMLPVLQPGDELVVDKRAYGFRLPGSSRAMAPSLPKRGDVVVFHKEVAGRLEELVKRVIGLPGDAISMNDGRVLINGWQIPYCDAGRYFYLPVGGVRPVDGRLVVEFLEDRAYLTVLTPTRPPFEHYSVKPGELFVLGDNRNASSDSRIWNEGRGAGVPLGDITGRSSRKLVGTTRAGRPDFGSLFEQFGTDLNLEGVDVRPLQANIARCFAERPPQTSPPRPN